MVIIILHELKDLFGKSFKNRKCHSHQRQRLRNCYRFKEAWWLNATRYPGFDLRQIKTLVEKLGKPNLIWSFVLVLCHCQFLSFNECSKVTIIESRVKYTRTNLYYLYNSSVNLNVFQNTILKKEKKTAGKGKREKRTRKQEKRKKEKMT